MLDVLQGDCREMLKTLPSESVHCCVTSPPYFGLRDYGTARWEGGDPDCTHGPRIMGNANKGAVREVLDGDLSRCARCDARRVDSQIGLEQSPEAYVATMVGIFREVRRVLRDDGTLWLNLGDSYAGSWGNSGNRPELDGKSNGQRDKSVAYLPRGGWDERRERPASSYKIEGFKPKDLYGIPWMVAFALRADGWYLRSEIIWAKPNPMPESVTDRPTKSHEQIFLLTKSPRYFYDAEAIREDIVDRTREQVEIDRKAGLYQAGRNKGIAGNNVNPQGVHAIRSERCRTMIGDNGRRNARSVWTIATSPYSDAHFATFPPKLVEPCILAGTSARGCCAECGAPWERVVEREAATVLSTKSEYGNGAGRNDGGRSMLVGASALTLGWQPTCEHDSEPIPCVVLDPFAGSGTVGKVALELGRKAILIELNPKYCEMIQRRSEVTLGLPGLA